MYAAAQARTQDKSDTKQCTHLEHTTTMPPKTVWDTLSPQMKLVTATTVAAASLIAATHAQNHMLAEPYHTSSQTGQEWV